MSYQVGEKTRTERGNVQIPIRDWLSPNFIDLFSTTYPSSYRVPSKTTSKVEVWSVVEDIFIYFPLSIVLCCVRSKKERLLQQRTTECWKIKTISSYNTIFNNHVGLEIGIIRNPKPWYPPPYGNASMHKSIAIVSCCCYCYCYCYL